MSSYVPTVVSPVRAGSFDREIDRMFDEALRAFGVSGRRVESAVSVVALVRYSGTRDPAAFQKNNASRANAAR